MTYETKQKPGVKGDKYYFYKLYIQKGIYDKKFILRQRLLFGTEKEKKKKKTKLIAK